MQFALKRTKPHEKAPRRDLSIVIPKEEKTEIFDGLLLESNLLFFLVLMFGYCKHYLLTIQTKPQSWQVLFHHSAIEFSLYLVLIL